jgi:aryl-alcohol dehydrogenase-like predicted oxidoreductase
MRDVDYINLGSSGLKVSRICLGTMTYGTKEWRKWCLGETEARPFYRRALELGINFFDTADMYSTGVSEEITGRALKEFCPSRDRLVITTKVCLPISNDPNDRGLSRKHIMASIDKSLKRLGTDYVDIYTIHRFDPSTLVEETLRALDDLVRTGKVLYLGASAMWSWQFAQMLAAQDARAYAHFVVMQNHYNIIYREEEREMIPLCRKEGIGITPFSPLARGLVTGERKLGNVGDTIRSQTDEYARRDYSTPSDMDVVARITDVSKKRGTPNVQVALAWLLAQPGVTAPIVGASKMSHLDDAVAALSVKLDASELKALAEPYQPHRVLSIV